MQAKFNPGIKGGRKKREALRLRQSIKREAKVKKNVWGAGEAIQELL